MSYGDYGFTKRSEAQSSYQEYSCKPRGDKEQSYLEYGDPKMSGTSSLFGSAQRPVNIKAFDEEMERYCEEQRKIKAQRLAERTAYCDEHGVQGDDREKILKGRVSIEEFEATKKSASELTEAPEQPAEAPVEGQTAETETVPEQPQTGKKKKSKKKTEEVSDAE